MTAERTPRNDESLATLPMEWMTRLVLRYPQATIAFAVALGAAAMFLTMTRLGYRTNRLDLLNPHSDYNRLWIDYIDEFGEEDDAVVVVEGDSRERVVRALTEISDALSRERNLFHAVLHEVDLTKIRGKGLHYLPEQELMKINGFLAAAEPIVRQHWSQLNLGTMAATLSARLDAELRAGPPNPASPTIHEVERLADSLAAVLGQQATYHSPWPGMPQSFATLSELSNEYLLTNEGRLGFVLLRLASGKDGFVHSNEATTALRRLIAQTQARYPDTRIGLTGLPIMENDEMQASQSSMMWASVLSFIGVACLFVAGFGGVRHALLANLVLLLGMAWSFGFVVLSVGHLNILSASFAVTLIGIGIDYGVHYVARYIQLRTDGMACEEALVTTARTVGPAIVTGALSTAVAFFATAWTDFTGVRELGIIAGGGLLLCAAAELFVLPAVLLLVDRSNFVGRVPRPLAVDRWVAPLFKTPKLLLASTVLFSAVLALGATRLWYDHNLLNMQPDGLESVELEKKLLAECNQSMWYALSIADSREELLARKEQFLKLASVERTEEIASLLPVDHERKQPLIAQIHQRLDNLPERPPVIPIDPPANLGRALGNVQALASTYGNSLRCIRQLEQVRDVLRRLPLSDCYSRLSQLQQQMAGDLLSRLHLLRSMANPEPPQLADLPESLVTRFVGKNQGRHLLRIYGRGDIWDMDALKTFVHEVRTVDPRSTGNPLQAYEASLDMKKSYEEAALYAGLVIMGVLLLDFRSLRYSLLAALPLAVGMVQLFGLMGLFNIPLNPANMICLPLLLGIGVDYGVHLVHEFREHSGPFRLAPSTAVAVLVDALTTIVGFGALMVASHKGLQSLGRVLTIGVACCMFTSLVMLPAVLMCIRRGGPTPTPKDSPNQADQLATTPLHRRYDPSESGNRENQEVSPARAPWPAVAPAADRRSGRQNAA